MKKILIIEDDQLVANIYRNKFAVDNFTVETALDGESGFDLIKSFQPDVVVLDLMLPKVSGLDVLKKIRAEPDLQHLPVIVFSNTFLSNMVQEAWKAGATKCLSKANCTPKQVIDVVRGVLNSAPGSANAAQPRTTATASATAVASMVGTSAAVAADVESEADDAFQTEVRQSFVSSLPTTLGSLRVVMQALAKSTDEASRIRNLQDLYRRIHAVTSNAGIAGMQQIAQMTDATEALLKELYEKPKNINASTIRTVALSIDFLGILFDKAKLPGAQLAPEQLKANILVVDDEAISRRAVTYALEKAKLPSFSVEAPEVALSMLGEKAFDLVFLDVDMPGMNGFELCTKLRSLHRNKTTPVVFVTSLNDFESRANSSMSGGNDLIAKPFVFMELAVKALVYIMRNRLAIAK
jgi:DNA-binding response OmpR family regulator